MRCQAVCSPAARQLRCLSGELHKRSAGYSDEVRPPFMSNRILLPGTVATNTTVSARDRPSLCATSSVGTCDVMLAADGRRHAACGRRQAAGGRRQTRESLQHWRRYLYKQYRPLTINRMTPVPFAIKQTFSPPVIDATIDLSHRDLAQSGRQGNKYSET